MTSPVMLGGGQVRLDEVYLSGSTGQGPAVVGGLALLADDHGLTVLGPQPSSARTMPWGRASTIACRQTAQLPDGRAAVMLEVDIDGNALRFFVPQANLGPQGAGALEELLTSLAGVPAALSPPVAIGGDGPPVSGWGPAGQPIASAIQGQAGQASQAASQGQANQAVSGQVAAPVTAGPVPTIQGPGIQGPGIQGPGIQGPGLAGQMPLGVMPAGALPPATGGTLSVPQGPSAGQYVRVVKRRHGRRSRVAAVLVVIVIAGAAGAYVLQSRKGSSGSSTVSADALAAARVNLAPGNVPGWKGVPGTIGGAIGAFGVGQAKNGHSAGSPSGSGVVASDAASFARCTKLPASRADAALAAMGFSQSLPAIAGQTALSSSPLFEDPSVPATATESSVMVLESSGEQAADASVFAGRSFAGCYGLYLSALVPTLIGGATSAVPFAYASVQPARVRSNETGVSVRGFSETFFRKGRPSRGALFGQIDVVAGGRMIAVFETISSHSFPAAQSTKLLAAVEQNVAGELS